MFRSSVSLFELYATCGVCSGGETQGMSVVLYRLVASCLLQHVSQKYLYCEHSVSVPEKHLVGNRKSD